jgi:plasmid stabilization system protein ParE
VDLFVWPTFYQDVAEEVESLARRASPEIAERWHAALDQTIQQLLRHPYLGRQRMDLNQPGVRSWRVNHFPRWLIFYAVRESAIVFSRALWE